jgi:tetratricopeptide (TPR) repeat protein
MAKNRMQKTLAGVVLLTLCLLFNCQATFGWNAIAKTFYVNSYVNTGIQVQRGATIRIAASGQVTFGFTAGTGGPGGVNWCYNEEYDGETGSTYCDDYNPYSYLQDVWHGSLLYRINSNGQDEWLPAGVGGEAVATHSGILELNVNDNDPGNNVGKFKVNIEVSSGSTVSENPRSVTRGTPRTAPRVRANTPIPTRGRATAPSPATPRATTPPPAPPAKKGPRTATDFYNLGLAHNKEGRFSEAIEPLKSAVKLNPKYAEARGELGHTYLKLGNCALAVDEYKAAVRLEPAILATQYGLGWCSAELKRYPDAVEPLRQSVRLDSTFPEAHRELGFVLMQTQQYNEAIEQLQMVVNVKPNDPVSHYYLGQIYLATSNKKRAQDEHKVLKKIDPARATQFAGEMKSGARIAEDTNPPMMIAETQPATTQPANDSPAKKELKRIWNQIKKPN